MVPLVALTAHSSASIQQRNTFLFFVSPENPRLLSFSCTCSWTTNRRSVIYWYKSLPRPRFCTWLPRPVTIAAPTLQMRSHISFRLHVCLATNGPAVAQHLTSTLSPAILHFWWAFCQHAIIHSRHAFASPAINPPCSLAASWQLKECLPLILCCSAANTPAVCKPLPFMLTFVEPFSVYFLCFSSFLLHLPLFSSCRFAAASKRFRLTALFLLCSVPRFTSMLVRQFSTTQSTVWNIPLHLHPVHRLFGS